jgi:hypothetical protein
VEPNLSELVRATGELTCSDRDPRILASSVHELYIPSAESRHDLVWIAAGFLVADRLERTLHGTKVFELGRNAPLC